MKQSGQIMNDLELVLRGDGPKPAMNRDPELYYFTVFGTPGDKAAWGWRVEGHHLSQNFTIANGTLTSWTPDFYGANPAEVMSGPRQGLRVLSARGRQGVRPVARARRAAASRPPSSRTRCPATSSPPTARRVDPLTPDGLTGVAHDGGAAEASSRADCRIHLAHGRRHLVRAHAPHQRGGIRQGCVCVDWRRRAARAALLSRAGADVPHRVRQRAVQRATTSTACGATSTAISATTC